MHPVFSFERKFEGGYKDFFKEIDSASYLELVHPFVADIRIFKNNPELTGTRYFVTFTNGIRLIEEVFSFDKEQFTIKVITYDKRIPFFFIRIHKKSIEGRADGNIGMQLLCQTKSQQKIFGETFPAIYRMGRVFFPEVLNGIVTYCKTGKQPEKLNISPDGQITTVSLKSPRQVRSPHEYLPS